MKKRQLSDRFMPMALNMLNNLLVPFFNVLISALVVRLVSVELWGEYTSIILLVSTFTVVSLWGSKDYLAAVFSRDPASVRLNWVKQLQARQPVTWIAAAGILILVPGVTLKLLSAGILVTRSAMLSYEPLVIYQRRFRLKLVAELSGGILLCMMIVLFHQAMSIPGFLGFCLFSELVKLGVIATAFHREFPLAFLPKFDLQALRASAGFLWLSLSGFLLYKADLYFIAIFLDNLTLAKYQVLMAFLIFIHASATYLVQPLFRRLFLQNIALVRKISARLFTNGTWMTLAALLVVNLVLEYAFGIRVSAMVLAAAWLFLLPAYYYAPLICYLFAAKRELAVLAVNTGGFISTAAACWLLNNLLDDPILAVMMAAAITQWLMLVTYILVTAKRPFKKEYIYEEK